MGPLYIRSIVLFLALSFLATFSLAYRKSSAESRSHFQSIPCENIVFVESQVGVPVLVSPMKCDQESSELSNVEFSVINTSKKPIIAFKIGAAIEYTNYKQPKGDGRFIELKFLKGKPLLPGWSERSSLGLGGEVLLEAHGIPVGPMTRFTLYVESVTFADSSHWANTK